MSYVFDPAKDVANIDKHGLSLADFKGFGNDPNVARDDRRDYGEVRFQARGRINGKGYCVIFTIAGDDIRLISFRRAHEREMNRHGQGPATR